MKLKKHLKEYDFVYFDIVLILTFWLSFIMTAYPFLFIFASMSGYWVYRDYGGEGYRISGY